MASRCREWSSTLATSSLTSLVSHPHCALQLGVCILCRSPPLRSPPLPSPPICYFPSRILAWPVFCLSRAVHTIWQQHQLCTLLPILQLIAEPSVALHGDRVPIPLCVLFVPFQSTGDDFTTVGLLGADSLCSVFVVVPVWLESERVVENTP